MGLECKLGNRTFGEGKVGNFCCRQAGETTGDWKSEKHYWKTLLLRYYRTGYSVTFCRTDFLLECGLLIQYLPSRIEHPYPSTRMLLLINSIQIHDLTHLFWSGQQYQTAITWHCGATHHAPLKLWPYGMLLL